MLNIFYNTVSAIFLLIYKFGLNNIGPRWPDISIFPELDFHIAVGNNFEFWFESKKRLENIVMAVSAIIVKVIIVRNHWIAAQMNF